MTVSILSGSLRGTLAEALDIITTSLSTTRTLKLRGLPLREDRLLLFQRLSYIETLDTEIGQPDDWDEENFSRWSTRLGASLRQIIFTTPWDEQHIWSKTQDGST